MGLTLEGPRQTPPGPRALRLTQVVREDFLEEAPTRVS